mgnify:CR=1 FL=1
MKNCFICKSEGIKAVDLSEDWLKELKNRNLIPYECPKCGDKWIANDRNEIYSEDGLSISINNDMMSIEERKSYLWDKYKVVYNGELFALGIREIDKNKIIDMYIEDDESLYLIKSFHENWLNDLINVSQEMKIKLNKK